MTANLHTIYGTIEARRAGATAEDEQIMARLVAVADALFDGHLTILKFSTNWRVGFGTPHADDLFDFNVLVKAMPVGATFAEAGRAALTHARDAIDGAAECKAKAYLQELMAI